MSVCETCCVRNMSVCGHKLKNSSNQYYKHVIMTVNVVTQLIVQLCAAKGNVNKDPCSVGLKSQGHLTVLSQLTRYNW